MYEDLIKKIDILIKKIEEKRNFPAINAKHAEKWRVEGISFVGFDQIIDAEFAKDFSIKDVTAKRGSKKKGELETVLEVLKTELKSAPGNELKIKKLWQWFWKKIPSESSNWIAIEINELLTDIGNQVFGGTSPS